MPQKKKIWESNFPPKISDRNVEVLPYIPEKPWKKKKKKKNLKKKKKKKN